MNLGKTIKTIRKQKGLKQYQLAEIVGLSTSALIQIEKDRSQPHKKNLMAIAKALDTDLGMLHIRAFFENSQFTEKQLIEILQ